MILIVRLRHDGEMSMACTLCPTWDEPLHGMVTLTMVNEWAVQHEREAHPPTRPQGSVALDRQTEGQG